MCEISVIMPVFNNKKNVQVAIKSILNQSFTNFELVIPDFGSTDGTLSIIKSFNDSRIRVVIQNNLENRVQALNTGLALSSSKYIAIMEPNHVMHVDRLKIQRTIMEAKTSIIVCGSHIKRFVTNKQEEEIANLLLPENLINNPLLAFLQGNCIIHTTAMIRNSFLKEHQLQYETYPGDEEFKLWVEIAKREGQFYVDTQTLLFSHTGCESEDRKNCLLSKNIIDEIVDFLVKGSPELNTISLSFKSLRDRGMMTQQEIIAFFYRFFEKNKCEFFKSIQY